MEIDDEESKIVQELKAENASMRQELNQVSQLLLKLQLKYGALEEQEANTRIKNSKVESAGPFSQHSIKSKGKEEVGEKFPDYKQAKITAEPFDGKELFPGVGTDFFTWGQALINKIIIAQERSSFNFPERAKIEILRDHLKGVALYQFEQDWVEWAGEPASFENVMNEMHDIFTTSISVHKGYAMMKKPMDKSKS